MRLDFVLTDPPLALAFLVKQMSNHDTLFIFS